MQVNVDFVVKNKVPIRAWNDDWDKFVDFPKWHNFQIITFWCYMDENDPRTDVFCLEDGYLYMLQGHEFEEDMFELIS